MSFAARPNWSVGVVSLAAIPNPVQDIEIDPTDATVSVTLGTDGSANYVGTLGTTNFSWFDPNRTGVGSEYWCRLTVNSGSTPSGSATGSILALSTLRSWSLTRTTIGTTTANVTLQIFSDAGGANVVATRTFDMTAFVDT